MFLRNIFCGCSANRRSSGTNITLNSTSDRVSLTTIMPTVIKNDRWHESDFGAPPPLLRLGNPARDTDRRNRRKRLRFRQLVSDRAWCLRTTRRGEAGPRDPSRGQALAVIPPIDGFSGGGRWRRGPLTPT